MSNRNATPGLDKRILTGAPMNWKGAACRDHDPELFFPLGTGEAYEHNAEKAKVVCRTCPIRDACLQWALDSPRAQHGVWGATTEEQRASYIRHHRKGN